ncbi:Hypothetical predicted protein [Olea europaea subsp. europaea]|uniref:Lactoylglutathione lyase n=1 Tax=Olea europaea subsp. europaea TaxID=158383 RepID=A0A8S0V5H3_OLEEU|nr:Hypothetical predicted protein [Olea europaea subsp. europaea]
MELIIQKLEEMQIEYVTALVKEGGISVDQLFFHDPDGYMIEICNCQNLPVLPLSSCPLKKLPNRNNNLTTSSLYGNKMLCNREVEALMLENLAAEMMDISI